MIAFKLECVELVTMNTIPVIEQKDTSESNIHYSSFTEKAKLDCLPRKNRFIPLILKQLFLSIDGIHYPLFEFVFLPIQLLSNGKDFAIWFEGLEPT
jgi:hypothetical protein